MRILLTGSTGFIGNTVLPALEAIGWGETCASYADPSMRGEGDSTPPQTGWALIALIAAGRVNEKSVSRGIRFLARTQRSDGAWDEPQFTAVGFPGYGIGDRIFKNPYTSAQKSFPNHLPSGFMIKYHMYRICWPLLVLGRYNYRSNTLITKGF